MSDFSDRPFVAGSLIGLRAFGVDKHGRLVGPSFGGVFKPGENAAECRNHSRAITALQKAGASVEASGMSFSGRAHYTVTLATGEVRQYTDPSRIAVEFAPSDEHQVGTADCSCGYYAYFDGGNDYKAENRVTAVVEGYGVCTVGERGFRASKARVLGFVKLEVKKEPEPEPEPEKKRTLWGRIYPHWWNGVLVAINAGFAVKAAILGQWVWQFAASASVVAVLAFIWLATVMADKAHKRRMAELDRSITRTWSIARVDITAVVGPPLDWSLIERNYPDVPIYPTRKAALAAHPLTAPPAPTPEDDDFWTRPVA